jgi:two-component system cell cycle sensor histidine kinase/response regulator CckA
MRAGLRGLRWRAPGRAVSRAVPIDRFGTVDELWRVLFEQGLSAGALLDEAGCIVTMNAALRDIVGGMAVVNGMSADLLFVASDREAVRANIADVRDRAAPHAPPRSWTARIDTGARRMATQDFDEAGTRVLVSAIRLRRADGQGGGIMLRLRDISQTTRLEAQLAHSQRLQVAGHLAGGVAHDFNNLLTAILGAAGAIDARGVADSETRDDLASIRAAANRGAALVRHLLAFGRQQTLKPRALAVNDVISELAIVLRRLLGGKITLELALEQPGRMVMADPTALDQVLLNLAVNARDAMPDGGVLTLRSGHMTLHRPLPRGPELIQPGRYVCLEVQDTGGGIPAEVLPHIFDPFFTTRRDLGGSGLGLSTAHGIVLQSGGFVAVESELGRGTRMRVYLPHWEDVDPLAIPPPPAPGGPETPTEPSRAPSPRGLVLLVEDEDSVRHLVERALLRNGWKVLSAPTAEAALDLLTESSMPSLAAVVTDLMMPGMSGTALVRALRQTLSAPALPAIVVSGYADESLQREIVSEVTGPAVGTMFLAKPYEIGDLLKKLADLVAAVEAAN